MLNEKQTTVGKLKDGTEFYLSLRRMRRVVWVVQTKKKGKATITASMSGVTRVVDFDKKCWV